MSDIPFESFSSLIYRLSHPPKSKPAATSATSRPSSHLSPEKIFASWLNHLPKPFVPHTGKHLFRLLFPHEGSRRRYGLQETLLARELGKMLCVDGLERWDCVRWEGEGGTGCLGKEVELIMRERIPAGTRSTLTIREVDQLLDALAAPSAFSQLSQPPPPIWTPTQLLTKLYRDSSLSPYSLSVLTQIILRDLRPLLNPLPQLQIRNPTAMLRIISTAGPRQLELLPAMRAWDGKMAEMYRGGKGSLDFCADTVEALGGGPGGFCRGLGIPAGPVVGVNVQIPKCEKGRSVESALNEFCGSQYAPAASVVWAETKYDGYRMQIHVGIKDNQPIITIFSKSKRNSTMDRLNTHSIIHAALGLQRPCDLPCHAALAPRLAETRTPSTFRTSVILEAEVVPYNEGEREGGRGPGIEEFWWLDAAGVTAGSGASSQAGPSRSVSTDRHLCLVFFDILHLNGESLLDKPYSKRRETLEFVIRPIPGFSLLCHRTSIPLHLGRTHPLSTLRTAFAQACQEREEGLVLKSAESTYNSPTHRWVKLKKDYIPNLGDCVDLVILGAGWDIDRARELRVDTSVFTTWYIGTLVNGDKVRRRLEGPHFEVLFRVSYGSSRDELEVWNSNIRMGRWGSKPYDKDDPYKKRLLGLSYTYFMPRNMTPPSVLFEQPLCAEIMGAGFQKLPWSPLYEIRWPRLQKIYDPRERPWSEAMDGPELIKIAHKSLGYLPGPLIPSGSPESDSVRALWRTASDHALDVLPDTMSPVKSSGGRMTRQRMRSAPDLGDVLKASPPTPRSSGLIDPRRDSPRSKHAIRSVGNRMREAVRAVQTAVADDPHKSDNFRRPSDALLTPKSSPLKRLGSPLLAPSPDKRIRRPITRTHCRIDQAAESRRPELVLPVLPTPPPTSLVLQPLSGNIDLADQGEVRSSEKASQRGLHDENRSKGDMWSTVDEAVIPRPTCRQAEPKGRSRKFDRALSLRSRIKLAFRGLAI